MTRGLFTVIGVLLLSNCRLSPIVSAEVRLVVEQLHALRPAARVLLHAILPRGSDEGTPHTRSFHRAPWWSAAAP